MSPSDNSYSRFIALAKVGLPLIALALLSTLFLFSRNNDPTQSAPYARVDVEELVRDQRVSAPNYTSVTSDGTAIAVSAASARPDPANPNRAAAFDVTARLDFPDGNAADITAKAGAVDTKAGQAHLSGGVTIDTTTGYHVTTQALITALDHTEVETESDVHAQGPLGDLQAGRMVLTPDPAAPGQYVVVFKDGVKLVYDPQR